MDQLHPRMAAALHRPQRRHALILQGPRRLELRMPGGHILAQGHDQGLRLPPVHLAHFHTRLILVRFPKRFIIMVIGSSRNGVFRNDADYCSP